MDITHTGQELSFSFDVFVEVVLYLFHCSFHIVGLILFHEFIILFVWSDNIHLCIIF